MKKPNGTDSIDHPEDLLLPFLEDRLSNEDRAMVQEHVNSCKECSHELQMLEDIYAMTGLYEAVHDHARAAGERLEPLIKQTGAGAAPVLDRDREVFGRIEQELIFLVSPFPLELKPPHEKATDPDHGAILREKRRDMLDRLFSLLPSP